MKALSFDDITLIPRFNNIASRKNVDTSVKFGGLRLAIPIMSANMDTITGTRMAKKMCYLGGLGFLHRFCSIEDNVAMFNEFGTGNGGGGAVMSLGVNEDMNRFQALYEVGARYFCIDVAHGHSREVGRMVRAIKEFDPKVFVVAGNVCTAEGAEYLADKGADAIKVGIGPGSVCTTRVKTGFGIPQFTAIQECRHVTCLLIADGGIRTPGDAMKAFAAGADAIMLGGMLAGTDETPGEVITNLAGFQERGLWLHREEKYKLFRGMASREAQESFMGSMNEWKTSEGIEIKVKAKGPVANVVSDLMGGIRSGMTYCGANAIQEIRSRVRWMEVTPAGRAEGLPHGEGRL